MIPADELVLVPGDTLTPVQWEAWYPTAVQRRRFAVPREDGSGGPPPPWYSWRESILEWPEWEGRAGAVCGVKVGSEGTRWAGADPRRGAHSIGR